MLDFLKEHFSNTRSIPNNFTNGMGELIQQARIEAGLNISDLADKIYTSKKTVEAFETGTAEVSSSQLTYLAQALNKPITYFFPEWLRDSLNPSYMTIEELEILRLINKLDDDDRQKLIAQIRAIINVS